VREVVPTIGTTLIRISYNKTKGKREEQDKTQIFVIALTNQLIVFPLCLWPDMYLTSCRIIHSHIDEIMTSYFPPHNMPNL